MRVYILTDMEGISGITLWEQCLGTGEPYEAGRRLLMGDIYAAVEGCLQGGATHVSVLDGHGIPYNLLPELMHPGAEYLTGSGFPIGWGLDECYDVAMQIGCHAMNRTTDGVLYHTQNHTSDARYWYNGRETGEIGQFGLELGHFGIPCVMVSGDYAACREGLDFFGPDLVTVPVKYGYGRTCARLLAPARTHELIREGAKEALSRVGKVKPYVMDLPLQAKIETLVEAVPDSLSLDEIIALPHRSHEGTCATALNVYSF